MPFTRCHLQELKTGLLTKGLPGALLCPGHEIPRATFPPRHDRSGCSSPRWKKSQVRAEGDIHSLGVRGPLLPALHPPRAQPRGGGSGGETEAFPAGERSPSPPGLRGFGRSAHLPGTRRADRALAHTGARHPRGRDTWRLSRPVPDLPLPSRRQLGCKRADARGPEAEVGQGELSGFVDLGVGVRVRDPSLGSAVRGALGACAVGRWSSGQRR